MHSLFHSVLTPQYFVERPTSRFGQPCGQAEIESLALVLRQHHAEIAALILEPVVQGAGGMYFYSADYLRQARALCDAHEVLLIADEIATGFGRSGRLFACEHAGIAPDIMCLGKSLTGGYLSLAATLASAQISDTIDQGDPGLFMHGPTFMGNPLACAAALASLELLLESDWQQCIAAIEAGLRRGLAPCAEMPQVEEVRCLGAIGVVEMKQPVDMARITREFVDSGVWVRPFGKLVYLMPAFVISEDDLSALCRAVAGVVTRQAG